MAAEKFPSPTHAQFDTRSFGRLPLSFSHGSSSFPHGHADQGGRPLAGSVAFLPHCVSPRLGGGDGGLLHGSKKGEDGGSHGGTGWSILESWRPGVNGGGSARGAVDRTLCTCCVCSRSFHGLEALQLHMKVCPAAPAAAAAEPPALLPQQEREKRPNEPVPTVLEVMRSVFGQWVRELQAMPGFAEILRAARETVSFAANLASPAAFGRGSDSAGAGAAAGVVKRGYACKVCGKTFKSGQVLGGHMTVHRGDRAPLASVPDANSSSSPPGFAMGKRPAMEEAAAHGNGKRRCIRLFGVDIIVEAPKE